MKMISVVSVLLFCLSSVYGTDFVKDGQPAAVIVLPAKPSIHTKRAAEELQYHLRKASGAQLEILPSGSDSSFHRIFLEKNDGVELDSLGRNGFRIRTVGDDLLISGEGEGTAQAVYYLLETEFGVRWLWPGESGEIIPQARSLSVHGLDIAFRQPVSSSRIHPSNTARGGWQSEQAWKAFNQATEIWYRRMGFSWDTSIRSQHAFGHPGWKYGEKYMKSHPEFFNMLPDGTRRPDPFHVGGAVEYCSTCPSSEGLLQQALQDWREKRHQGYPFGPNLFLGENDAKGSCCCEECLAADLSDDPDRLQRTRKRFLAGDAKWMDELGNVTERYMQFYLRGLAEAKKIDPSVKVIGWANYANYAKPPKHTRLNADVVLAYVGGIMYPWTRTKMEGFKQNWQGWHDAGPTLVFRPNFMLDGHNMPVNFGRKFHEIYRFCLENAMIGTEFDSCIGQFGGNGFNYYVMSRMTRHPELSFEAIQQEYCSGFGAAAGEIQRYLEYWEEISDSQATVDACNAVRHNPVGVEIGSWNYFYTKAPLVYTQEVMNKGFSILERAASLVENDVQAAARVAFLRKGLQHAQLTLEAQRVYESGSKYHLAEAVKKLDEFRAGIEADFVANMHHLSRWENVCWDRTSLYFMMNAPGTPLLEGWKFSFDPHAAGEAQQWFSESFDVSGWADTGIDTGWELQPAGKAWKEAHNGQDYDGTGWYRNAFLLKPEDQGKKVVLTFGAVDESCVIWVNDRKVLERPFPYQGDSNSWMTPFTVEVTEAVRFDAPNILAVRVEDTGGQGGIWRPVWFRTEEDSAGGANLIRNPGLEEDGKINNSWQTHRFQGKYEHGIDEEIYRSGKKSYRMTCLELNPHGANIFENAWMRIFQKVPVEKEKTCVFRSWYRTDSEFSGQVRIWVLGKGVKYEFTGTNTNGLWMEACFPEVKTGQEAEEVTVYLNTIGGKGTVWFDDVELFLK